MFLINPYIYSSASYLLDDYTAAHGYSLRQLKTGVTSVVRVRRTSDNAESDFSATEVTDGTLLAWVLVNSTGGRVVKLYDQVGSNDLVQSTAANQPAIVILSAVLTKNGKPTINFDGVNEVLNSTTVITEMQTYPFSTFTVSNTLESSSVCFIWSTRNATGDNSGVFLNNDRRAAGTAYTVTLDDGATSNQFNDIATNNTTNQRLNSFTISSGGDGEMWWNGASQETITGIGAFATTPTQVLELGYLSINSNYYHFDLQEHIIFNTDETSNQSAIESNINTEFSIF